MSMPPAVQARLAFLIRVVQKESTHLQQTDGRLFGRGFSLQDAQQLGDDPDRSEQADAFVGRFGRLQDTLGDKLLPLLLRAIGENTGAAMDNLDKAERLGWLDAEEWARMRGLRNQMVHEYVEDAAVLLDALQTGHEFVPKMVWSPRPTA